MNYEDLTPDLMEKARACKTPEELLALAKAEGYKLSADELDAIAGGDSWYKPECKTNSCDHYCPVIP